MNTSNSRVGWLDWLNSVLAIAVIGGAIVTGLLFIANGAAQVSTVFRIALVGNFVLHFSMYLLAQRRGLRLMVLPMLLAVAMFGAMAGGLGTLSALGNGYLTPERESLRWMLMMSLVLATILAGIVGWVTTILEITNEVSQKSSGKGSMRELGQWIMGPVDVTYSSAPPIGWSRQPSGVLVRQLESGGRIERDLFFVFREFDGRGTVVRQWTANEDEAKAPGRVA